MQSAPNNVPSTPLRPLKLTAALTLITLWVLNGLAFSSTFAAAPTDHPSIFKANALPTAEFVSSHGEQASLEPDNTRQSSSSETLFSHSDALDPTPAISSWPPFIHSLSSLRILTTGNFVRAP